MPIKLILFDFDLTLVDSRETVYQSYQELQSAHNIRVDCLDFNEIWGIKYDKINYKIAEGNNFSHTPEEIMRLGTAILKKNYAKHELCALKDLERLQEKYELGIVSSNTVEIIESVVDVLVGKTIKAAKEYKAKTVMLSGGVSANKELRERMEQEVNAQVPSSKFQVPSMEYTTDNAAMIAAAGYFRARNKKLAHWSKLKVDPNLELR